jgi:hypothetical protein
MGRPDPAAEKKRWMKICDKEGKCARCPPHDNENRRRRARSDRHKTRRKGR